MIRRHPWSRATTGLGQNRGVRLRAPFAHVLDDNSATTREFELDALSHEVLSFVSTTRADRRRVIPCAIRGESTLHGLEHRGDVRLASLLALKPCFWR